MDLKDKLEYNDLVDVIQDTSYYVFPGTTLTVVCVTLKNGYTVTGESACVDPTNFNKELGEKYALQAAITKLWSLEGYLLKQAHYDRHQEQMRAAD